MTTITASTTFSTPIGDRWLWMEAAACRIDNPIQPVDDYDRRRAVKDLIEAYQSELDQLRDAIKDDPLFQPTKHDDLWLIRFLLSHKMKHDKALEAAKYTLQFRREHLLDEFDIRSLDINNYKTMETKDTHPYAASLQKLLSKCEDNTYTAYIPDGKRGVIHMIHSIGVDQHRLAKELTAEEYFQAYLMSTEWIFQRLDTTTRTTGLLTKCLRLVDVQGASMKMVNKENKKREANNTTLCEDVYPQLAASFLILNAPMWIDMVFSMVKPFVPKRVLEKVGIVKPLKKQNDLERIMEHCSKENLLDQYGGDLTRLEFQNMVPKAIK